MVRFLKRRGCLLIAVFLLGTLVYKILNFDPLGQSVIQKIKINNLATLYIVEASAGAMTSFSYRYYMLDAKLTDAEAEAVINEREINPFLITNDRQATVEQKERCFLIKINGTIYQYNSPAAYKIATGIYHAPICIEARPW